VSEDSVQYEKKRPIVSRAERARRSLSWWMQAGFIEGWSAMPEFDAFVRAGRRLLKAIDDKGGKHE
jgi:hypothetical protein